MIKVITYGTYDLLHYGHIRLLERAKALGDYLIVGITSDDFDRRRGKINNQQTLMERIAAVESTKLADQIIIEEYEGQKIDDIRKYNVDIFTVGSDWIGKFDYLNEYCKVIYLERTPGISSTFLRSENQKLKIGIKGRRSRIEKYKKESYFVNGIDLYENDFTYEQIDAMIIVSMPQDHYDDTKNALLHGKHVLCEAPSTMHVNQYKELQDIAKENNCVFMEGIKTAYSTAYSRLLLLAKSGYIGNITSIDSVCTSLIEIPSDANKIKDINKSICGWGPTALLPIFQLLGVDYLEKHIVSHYIDKEQQIDGFTKIDFLYPNAVASIKVANSVKSEGQLIISGTKGYFYVPAPWWKTDYFEARFENEENNKRFFYQLDGDGLRYEIIYFIKTINHKIGNYGMISPEISSSIIKIIEQCSTQNINII